MTDSAVCRRCGADVPIVGWAGARILSDHPCAGPGVLRSGIEVAPARDVPVPWVPKVPMGGWVARAWADDRGQVTIAWRSRDGTVAMGVWRDRRWYHGAVFAAAGWQRVGYRDLQAVIGSGKLAREGDTGQTRGVDMPKVTSAPASARNLAEKVDRPRVAWQALMTGEWYELTRDEDYTGAAVPIASIRAAAEKAGRVPEVGDVVKADGVVTSFKVRFTAPSGDPSA